MSTLLLPEAEMDYYMSAEAASRLRSTMAAARVSFTWFGTRKSLTIEQKAQAAESFGAAGQFLTAGKKLLDSKHPAFKRVTSIRGRIVNYWKENSLPFPEPGIRLIRQAAVDEFDGAMTAFQIELNDAVSVLDGHFDDLRAIAQQRLGALYNPSDYPMTLNGLFGVNWDFPSVEPPEYLRRLNPELFEGECRRVAARFDEAVKLAEDAFITELSRLVNHLSERLSGSEDGKPKIFRDTAVENLREFFGRFKELNIRSDGELDALVFQAQQIVSGVQPQQLRENSQHRQQIATRLAGVQAALDGLMVDRPRRSIVRPVPREQF